MQAPRMVYNHACALFRHWWVNAEIQRPYVCPSTTIMIGNEQSADDKNKAFNDLMNVMYFSFGGRSSLMALCMTATTTMTTATATAPNVAPAPMTAT